MYALINLDVAWFAARDVAKHTAQGKIEWLTGSDVRTSSIFARCIRNVNVCNGPKWQENIAYIIFYAIIQLLTYVLVDMECFKISSTSVIMTLLFIETPCPT